MMINNIKMMNDMELEMAAGGHVGPDPLFNTTKELLDRYKEQNLGEKQDEAFYNAVGTAWEVVKYAFEICG